MFCEKFVTSFSDCAYIIYSINENDENDVIAFHYYIHDSLIDLVYTISTIQINGFMCRGGITYGELYYEKESNFIFGPAINEAFKLETDAMMPRIIFNDELGNRLYKKESIVIKDDFRKLIRKDKFDNRYYLNYLYAFSQFDYELSNERIQLGDKEYSFEECYDILKKYSQDTIKNNSDHKIIAKHEWQLRYLRQHHKEREV
jgi:hypothetical protein